MSLGSNIKSARLAKGWSQEMLTREAGVSDGYISNIETGKSSPSLQVIEKIASALGTTVSALIDLNEGKKPAVAHLKIQKELPVEPIVQLTESPTIKAMLDDRRDRLDAIESLVSALMKDSVPVAKIKALIALVEVE